MPHVAMADTMLEAQVEAMDDAIEHYDELVKSGGWSKITSSKKLEPGMTHPAVAELRTILAAMGDMAQQSTRSATSYRASKATQADHSAPIGDDFYDSALLEAVQHFQARHGLGADGVVGPATRSAINVPAADRLAQLKVSRQKVVDFMQAHPDFERGIVVNIPAFMLWGLDQGEAVMHMPVIVGTKKRQTPQFSKAITYLEFNPRWYVPQKIAGEDLLPKIQKDPGFVARSGFTLTQEGERVDAHAVDWAQYDKGNFPFRLTQQSGRSNALGKVKFYIPDNRAIYLHDTSKPYLFKQSSRALSSGCIRVEDPLTLSKFVLGHGKGFSPEQADSTFNAANLKGIQLDTPVDTFAVYWTTWIEPGSKLPNFYDDIYGVDRQAIRQKLEESIAN